MQLVSNSDPHPYHPFSVSSCFSELALMLPSHSILSQSSLQQCWCVPGSLVHTSFWRSQKRRLGITMVTLFPPSVLFPLLNSVAFSMQPVEKSLWRAARCTVVGRIMPPGFQKFSYSNACKLWICWVLWQRGIKVASQLTLKYQDYILD